ncbi:hypothetical protein BURKHO8Y_210123 [Burkholderia sp. 8Y]|nr:hypothetical protein BURKHO8Y_210123 [Burkholderia sp. 8Y]
MRSLNYLTRKNKAYMILGFSSAGRAFRAGWPFGRGSKTEQTSPGTTKHHADSPRGRKRCKSERVTRAPVRLAGAY